MCLVSLTQGLQWLFIAAKLNSLHSESARQMQVELHREYILAFGLAIGAAIAFILGWAQGKPEH
jgi:hypothetical protein